MIDTLSTWPHSSAGPFKDVKLVDDHPRKYTQRKLEASLDSGLPSQGQFDATHRGIKLNEWLESSCIDGEYLNFANEAAPTYHRPFIALD